MKEIDFVNLPKLIDQLQALANGIPRVGATGAGMEIYHQAINALEVKLKGELGARVLQSAGATSIALAGVRSSATSGFAGALHNWIGAARRKLSEHEASK
jgi:hypothetical protein